MPSYLLEAYTPPSVPIADLEAGARRAAAELSRTGTPVRYVRSVFVPEDETCFHLLDGGSREVVAETARRAGISPLRITEVIPSEDGTVGPAAPALSEPQRSCDGP